MQRILVTGAAGRIGRNFAPYAAERYWLRVADRLADADYPNEFAHETVTFDLVDPDACRAACEGIDTVVHLGADASTQTGFYESLLANNIQGAYNLFQAALDAGCRRVIFASSIQVIAGYPLDVQATPEMPVRPPNLYAVTKCFGEALAHYYAYAKGLSSIAVRVGSYEGNSDSMHADARRLSAHISVRDMNHLLTCCIEAVDVNFAIVQAVSDNRFKRMDITSTRELIGYRPQDDAFEFFGAGLNYRQRWHDERTFLEPMTLLNGVGFDGGSARPFIFLSIGAALLTIALKSGAYLLTGSVGLLSDAVESVVNLVAALVALWALTLAEQPPDAEHAFGHSKAEYFASAVEGLLILIAALGIGATAVGRLFAPRSLEHVWLGLAISLAAALVNGSVAWILARAGTRLRSITLIADAQHLLTDVWTSAGVVVGVLLVQITGWLALDPLIALIVSVNIAWTGVRLMRTTADGVLDGALPAKEQALIANLLAHYQLKGIAFHALRTRAAGQRRFISFHILTPGAWSVQRGHDLADEIEQQIHRVLPNSTVFSHLEPIEDALSWDDQTLDRIDPSESDTPAPHSDQLDAHSS